MLWAEQSELDELRGDEGVLNEFLLSGLDDLISGMRRVAACERRNAMRRPHQFVRVVVVFTVVWDANVRSAVSEVRLDVL